MAATMNHRFAGQAVAVPGGNKKRAFLAECPSEKTDSIISNRLAGGLFADLETDEATDGNLVSELFADGGDVFLDGDFGILLHETLIEQADGLIKLLQLAFDDLGNRLRGLVLHLFRGDFFFLIHDGRVKTFAGNRARAGSGDLQGDVAHELLEIFTGHGGFFASADFHEHADFGAGVDVGRNESVTGNIEAVVAGNLNVFTDLGDDGDAIGFEIDTRVQRNLLGEFIAEGAEGFVLGNEIGFAIHFQQDAGLGAREDVLRDDAFVGGAVRFLGGAGDTFFAENVHGGIHVAGGFSQCLFAIHQACAGHLAEFADGSSSNFSHTIFLFGVKRNELGGPDWPPSSWSDQIRLSLGGLFRGGRSRSGFHCGHRGRSSFFRLLVATAVFGFVLGAGLH